MIYEGSKFDMESFFGVNKYPTPKRFNPIGHCISVAIEMNKRQNYFGKWSTIFKEWQEEVEEDEGDFLADDIEICVPIRIPKVIVRKGVVNPSRFNK